MEKALKSMHIPVGFPYLFFVSRYYHPVTRNRKELKVKALILNFSIQLCTWHKANLVVQPQISQRSYICAQEKGQSLNQGETTVARDIMDAVLKGWLGLWGDWIANELKFRNSLENSIYWTKGCLALAALACSRLDVRNKPFHLPTDDYLRMNLGSQGAQN